MSAQGSRLRAAESPVAVAPRLLNLHQAATYIGLSFWTTRDYVLAGYIPTIAFPPLRPREGNPPKRQLRRVLIDRRDLDVWIEGLKHERT